MPIRRANKQVVDNNPYYGLPVGLEKNPNSGSTGDAGIDLPVQSGAQATPAVSAQAPAPLTLLPPNTIIVKSQTVRISPEGGQVVDVIFTVQDVNGSERYEIRVSKV